MPGSPNIWIEEFYTRDFTTHICLKVEDYLHHEQTEFQTIDVVDTQDWGRVLFLDNIVMVCDKYEFCYHEMITHVPLFSHPSPSRVLIIGGGDGGTAREVLKHSSIKHIDMVEIDGRVVEVAKQYFPAYSSAFSDSRLKVHVADGIKFVSDTEEKYDLIIVDSTDPIGPATGLFEEDFYRNISRCLSPDGFFVFQSESPFYFSEFQKTTLKKLRNVFGIIRPYISVIPMYPGSLWTFTACSNSLEPGEIRCRKDLGGFDLKYFNYEIHKACFALPEFAKKIFA